MDAADWGGKEMLLLSNQLQGLCKCGCVWFEAAAGRHHLPLSLSPLPFAQNEDLDSSSQPDPGRTIGTWLGHGKTAPGQLHPSSGNPTFTF